MAILRERMLAVVDKILVHLVDDDDGVRGTLARLLLSGGYRVREYASGDELLEAARKDPLLSKPYRKQDLGRAVRAVLDEAMAEREA